PRGREAARRYPAVPTEPTIAVRSPPWGADDLEDDDWAKVVTRRTCDDPGGEVRTGRPRRRRPNSLGGCARTRVARRGVKETISWARTFQLGCCRVLGRLHRAVAGRGRFSGPARLATVIRSVCASAPITPPRARDPTGPRPIPPCPAVPVGARMFDGHI
ncbi:MAG: hypothetical protein ACLQRM_00030, partial [Acidimicrobiales bacterium]